jgi:hypothetical protein
MDPENAYAETSEREPIRTELDRIATRVSGPNLTRLEPCALTIPCVQKILEGTAGIHPELPMLGAADESACRPGTSLDQFIPAHVRAKNALPTFVTTSFDKRRRVSLTI